MHPLGGGGVHVSPDCGVTVFYARDLGLLQPDDVVQCLRHPVLVVPNRHKMRSAEAMSPPASQCPVRGVTTGRSHSARPPFQSTGNHSAAPLPLPSGHALVVCERDGYAWFAAAASVLTGACTHPRTCADGHFVVGQKMSI